MHILVADDDDLLRDYIQTAITKDCGHTVDMASTVSEALCLLDKNKYDRAVIDLRFKNESKTGFDILESARNKGVKERIIFTSVSNQMDLISVGATAAFRKPLSIKKIAKFLLTNDYSALKEGEIF